MSCNELSSDMHDKIMDMGKCGMCGDLDDSCGFWQCEECQKTFDKNEDEEPKDSDFDQPHKTKYKKMMEIIV